MTLNMHDSYLSYRITYAIDLIDTEILKQFIESMNNQNYLDSLSLSELRDLKNIVIRKGMNYFGKELFDQCLSIINLKIDSLESIKLVRK